MAKKGRKFAAAASMCAWAHTRILAMRIKNIEMHHY
jgi:hypothetical protein